MAFLFYFLLLWFCHHSSFSQQCPLFGPIPVDLPTVASTNTVAPHIVPLIHSTIVSECAIVHVEVPVHSIAVSELTIVEYDVGNIFGRHLLISAA